MATTEGQQPTHPRLIEAGQLLAPSEVAGFASEHAQLECGADRAVVYLVNYGLTSLVPLPGPATDDRRVLALEGSFAGRAFIVGESVVSDGGADGIRVWCPLEDGALRIGVVEIVFDSAEAPVSLSACHRFAAELAALIVLKERYGDVFAFVRRSARMSVAAEMPGTTQLRSSRLALRAERARVSHWRRLVGASLDLAVAATAVPEEIGDDAMLLDMGPHALAPRRSALVRAMRWNLPTSEVHRLPELRELDEQLACYARFLDASLADKTAQLIEILATDPAAALRGLPHAPDHR